jgi:hypothetical protein
VRGLFAALICASGIVAPVVIKAITYTHFVRPDGSATSTCTQTEPCSLARAAALAGGRDMPPGSVVLVQYGADGVYSQGALNFAGSGSAGNPIMFIGENGVRLTGTRFKPDPRAWTRVPGRKYTYQLDWDEQKNFTSSNPAQRPPVPNWRPIVVEDRRPPFTTPARRQFALEFPPRYSNRISVDQVEAQSCTHWNDIANNKVYVHTCDDGPPSDQNNLHLSSTGWGSIVISGDYLWFENIAMEHASSSGGGGLRVNQSADGTVLKRITARAVDVILRGTNTVAEDLDISHVILQGNHRNQCYDANPDFGVGECWNAAGEGKPLYVGVEGSSASAGQVVRRARVHRSWNGATVAGPNTIEDSTFWGFANHTFASGGHGGTVRRNVFLNGQDSFYNEGTDFDDLTVENNVFVDGVLFWVSRDGKGGTPPSGWRFRYNIASSIVYDDKTYPAVTSDCNLYIPLSADAGNLMRVVGTEGRAGASYQTLAHVQDATRLEGRSMTLPYTKWTDGTLFRRFRGEMFTDFDFQPAEGASLNVCGRRVGPYSVEAPGALRIFY